jgi:hypothetical protein
VLGGTELGPAADDEAGADRVLSAPDVVVAVLVAAVVAEVPGAVPPGAGVLGCEVLVAGCSLVVGVADVLVGARDVVRVGAAGVPVWTGTVPPVVAAVTVGGRTYR